VRRAPRPRFERLDDEKKQRIRDAAAAGFAKHGYIEASYNQIIEAAGVSKGAMYYYFDDKLDLFCTVLERLMREMMKTPGSLALEVETQEAYWRTMRDHFRTVIRASQVQPQSVELGKVFMSLPPEMREEPRIARLFEVGNRWIVELLEAGTRVGAIRQDIPLELLARIIMATDEALDRFYLPRSHPFSPVELDDLAAVAADFFRRTCEARTKS